MFLSPESSNLRSRGLAMLAILAPALGGCGEPWARGALFFASGMLLLIAPPRRSPGVLWLALAGVLLGLAGTTFLPWGWGPLFGWRVSAAELGIALPGTITPQPWVSIEAVGQFAGALLFALTLAAHRWEREEHRSAVRWYGAGMILLAVLALVADRIGWHVPWWPATGNSVTDFGFFPNRNQTANVLALGGIVVLGLAFNDLSRGRWPGYGWCAGLLVLGLALVQTHSRAGVALFLGGGAAWVFFPLRFSAAKKGATLGFAAVLVLVTLFLLFGGRTLERFQASAAAGGDTGRAKIHGEAIRLANAQPWIGHGAGNFERIFALTREPGPEQSGVLHPESDWLWLAAELGWVAVGLVAAGLAVWLWQTRPYDSGSGRYLRSAAAVGGVAFALHGLMDVSGHRLGALWPALLLLSLARQRRVQPDAVVRWAAPGFRLAGAGLVALGAWWLAAAARPERSLAWPTSATLAWLDRRADEALAGGEVNGALEAAEAGLRIQPLNWSFHYQRGAAIASGGGDRQEAARAFDRARFLQPRYAQLTMSEGLLWLTLGDAPTAMEAFSETLRRAGPRAPGFFNEMVTRSWQRTEMREYLSAVSRREPALLLSWLAWARPLEVQLEIARVRDLDPELKRFTDAERRGLFEVWSRMGDPETLVALIREHPEWMPEAWLGLAKHYAKVGDLERAWRFAEQYGPTPALPALTTGKSVAELERGFQVKGDLLDGVGLVINLRNLRQNEEALATLKELGKMPGRPVYLGYLEAKMRAEREEWKLAWEAWERYYHEASAGK